MRTNKPGVVSAFIVAVLGSIAGCSNVSVADKPLAGLRPNILLIVADDLGYNDLGVFGSEIRTPNIDRLARTGTILTNFYTAPLCAPTRAMLLSGTDPHRAGEGLMDTRVEGAAGYEGYLNQRVVSLATRLQGAGYHTYMTGKWHLGYEDDQSAAVHGFERSFTLLPGGASHFATGNMMPGAPVRYRENGKLIDALPKDFYSTVYYTDKMLDYMKEHASDGKPFFAYLAYTAPHWPVHALDEDIARQHGRYDEGYEVLRQSRFAAWKAAGFAPQDAQLPNLPPDYKPWDSLSPEEKAKSARAMEVYAAMVERMDSEIGRVLKYLEDSGQLNNTIVMFQSDNGAEGMEGFGGAGADNSLQNIGRVGSWAFIGRGWAEAGSAPFYLQKFSTAEGGIHVPAIVNAPALGIPGGRRDDSVLTASDVAPTFLELAGAGLAAPSNRPDALPITGRSFAGVLQGNNSLNKRGTDDVLGWEHSGNAAIRKGDWKLLWVGRSILIGGGPGQGPGAGAGGGPGGRGAGAGPGVPSGAGQPSHGAAPPGVGRGSGSGPGAGPAAPGSPAGPIASATTTRASLEAGGVAGQPVGVGGPWMLFNVREDPAELHDLSKTRPEVMAQMLVEWNRYIADYGVIVKNGIEAK